MLFTERHTSNPRQDLQGDCMVSGGMNLDKVISCHSALSILGPVPTKTEIADFTNISVEILVGTC